MQQQNGEPEVDDDAREVPALVVLRKRPEWSRAVESLRSLYEEHGHAARDSAAEYVKKYQGRRGAMVFDVIASRQRRYIGRVLPMVKKWESDTEEPSLAWLASHPPEAARYGLRSGEAETMTTIATNFRELAGDLGIDEDDACRTWAAGVVGLQHAPGLDPVVGSVKGVGTALFAYMQMRSGGDAVKPDLRVKRGLRRLGFVVPGGMHATLIVARSAAAEIATNLLVLDQLLWSLDDRK